ncbi:MAG: lipocalin family protein [Bacteroidia bacterium]|nr:lipocalin family protein [Bacteroidia bacterium]
MKINFCTFCLTVLSFIFFSINSTSNAAFVLYQSSTNDSLVTVNKLTNTKWQVVKHDRLSKDKKKYNEFLAEPNNVVSYTFRDGNSCEVTNGAIVYSCTWIIKNNNIIITENTQHNKFIFYVKQITSNKLIMVNNYKANQETIILLNKIK